MGADLIPSHLEPAARVLTAWGLTYLVHSTLLIVSAFLISRLVLRRAWALQDTLFKIAVVGGVVTATLQCGLGAPWAYRLALSDETRPATVAAKIAPLPEAPQDVTARDVAETPETTPEFASLDAESSSRTANALTQPIPSAPRATPPVTNLPALPARADFPWALALVTLWATVALLGVFRLALARWQLSRALGRRRPVISGSLCLLLDRLREELGIRVPVFLTWSTTVPTPVALGTREICVPLDAMSRIDEEQQESMLAHELGHLVRQDPSWLLVCGFIEKLFFFQPLNRIARRQIQRTAEYLADDWAVGATGETLPLASCLVEVASWSRQQRAPMPPVAMARETSQLVVRVERLIQGDTLRPTSAWLRRAFAFAPLLTVVIAAPGFIGTRVEHAEIRAVRPLLNPDLADDTVRLSVRTAHHEWRIERHGPGVIGVTRDGTSLPASRQQRQGEFVVIHDEAGQPDLIVRAPDAGGVGWNPVSAASLRMTFPVRLDVETVHGHQTFVVHGAERPHVVASGEWEGSVVDDPRGMLLLDASGAVRFRLPLTPTESFREGDLPVGIAVSPVSEAVAAQLGVDPTTALLVTRVEDGSPAMHAGVRRYDVIEEWNGRAPEVQAIEESCDPEPHLRVRRKGAPLLLIIDRLATEDRSSS